MKKKWALTTTLAAMFILSANISYAKQEPLVYREDLGYEVKLGNSPNSLMNTTFI